MTVSSGTNSFTKPPYLSSRKVQVSLRFPRRRDCTQSARLLTIRQMGDSQIGKILAISTVIVLAALIFAAGSSAAATHGFRDADSPTQAARVFMELPTVTTASCHWKIRPQTIACTFTSDDVQGTMVIWSTGGKILYRGCVQGSCVTRVAKHRFGHPY